MISKDFLIERMILRIGNQLNNMRDLDLSEKGLTTAQSESLLFYAGQDELTVTDLKEYLKISHQAARNITERLKNGGFIYTVASTTDSRANIICLTNKGKNTAEILLNTGASVGKQLLNDFSEDEKKIFLDFLLRASENIDRG